MPRRGYVRGLESVDCNRHGCMVDHRNRRAMYAARPFSQAGLLINFSCFLHVRPTRTSKEGFPTPCFARNAMQSSWILDIDSPLFCHPFLWLPPLNTREKRGVTWSVSKSVAHFSCGESSAYTWNSSLSSLRAVLLEDYTVGVVCVKSIPERHPHRYEPDSKKWEVST